MAALPLLARDGSIRAYTYIDADLALAADVGGCRWSLSHGYAMRRTGGRSVFLHRVLLGLAPGDREADHINRDTLDNRGCNLRIASRAENAQNMAPRAASGLRNIYWEPRRRAWRVAAHLGGASIQIGRFSAMLDAVAARDRWHAEHMPFAVHVGVPPIDHRTVVVLPAPPSRRGRNGAEAARALSLDAAREIRRRRLAGERGRALAAEFGVSEQLVCCIAKGRKYL